MSAVPTISARMLLLHPCHSTFSITASLEGQPLCLTRVNSSQAAKASFEHGVAIQAKGIRTG